MQFIRVTNCPLITNTLPSMKQYAIRIEIPQNTNSINTISTHYGIKCQRPNSIAFNEYAKIKIFHNIGFKEINN